MHYHVISNSNEQASSVIKRLIRGIEKPTHYLHSVDDRYLPIIYIQAGIGAVPYLEKYT